MSAESEQSGPSLSPADLDRVMTQPELVTVKMLDREYQIKSDQPDLVQFLADEVNREGQELRLRNPRLSSGQFDWAVQVAFRIALSRYQLQKSLNKYKALMDKSAEELSARIDQELCFQEKAKKEPA